MGWLAKVKRRRGGVYLWRVDHHVHRFRRVNGYVGETVSYYFRSRQHMGSTHFQPDGTRSKVAAKTSGQPWSDLNPRMYKVLPLPWWLCWKWVLRPLETLVILVTWPVYNDAKNRWNPRRISKVKAKAQRVQRDAGWAPARARAFAGHVGSIVYRTAGIMIVVLGIYGAVKFR